MILSKLTRPSFYYLTDLSKKTYNSCSFRFMIILSPSSSTATSELLSELDTQPSYSIYFSIFCLYIMNLNLSELSSRFTSLSSFVTLPSSVDLPLMVSYYFLTLPLFLLKFSTFQLLRPRPDLTELFRLTGMAWKRVLRFRLRLASQASILCFLVNVWSS